MDDVTRGGFVLDTTAVIDAYHIATSHMVEHGWVDGRLDQGARDPDRRGSKELAADGSVSDANPVYSEKNG